MKNSTYYALEIFGGILIIVVAIIFIVKYIQGGDLSTGKAVGFSVISGIFIIIGLALLGDGINKVRIENEIK